MDEHEPPFALKRELADEERDRMRGDRQHGRRITRIHHRVSKLERAGEAMVEALRKIAFNAKVNNLLTLLIVLVLVVIRWPDLFPIAVKGFAKMVGL